MKKRVTHSVEVLPWDSEILGLCVGRIGGPWQRENLSSLLQSARQKKIKYLLSRVEVTEWDKLQSLLARGFQIVDILTTWRLGSHKPRVRGVPGIRVRHFHPMDIPRLALISKESFVYDRFHADDSIPRRRSDNAHAKWIENSCLGKSDAVLVALQGDTPCGFISLDIDVNEQKKRIGRIVLIAVASKFRGRKVGYLLVDKALAYFQRRVDGVEVGTQLRNYVAWKIYQKSGFLLDSASVTLRKRWS